MGPTYQASLTPEQLAAIAASGGIAHCEDPTNQVRYQLIQLESSDVNDDYIREKIEEAYADREGTGPLDMSAIKAELNRRLAAKSAQGR
jgi:hypothetical protein